MRQQWGEIWQLRKQLPQERKRGAANTLIPIMTRIPSFIAILYNWPFTNLEMQIAFVMTNNPIALSAILSRNLIDISWLYGITCGN
ncbi:hypothetical protein HYG89_14270 [Acinetobacter sp. SwsAc5]|uniref:hypothetical protein n=1 Tax=Acinetobacter sp. SwsAc5 TaxID=2749438 RepID=UPI0015B8AE83|nr:hypothetical protein [Acinetobacter sp. SwsAc5]NWK53689.1 hypothetical protein [Acinetobacter sp. SwsAc5]